MIYAKHAFLVHRSALRPDDEGLFCVEEDRQSHTLHPKMKAGNLMKGECKRHGHVTSPSLVNGCRTHHSRLIKIKRQNSAEGHTRKIEKGIKGCGLKSGPTL
jgi:hypothetical protein